MLFGLFWGLFLVDRKCRGVADEMRLTHTHSAKYRRLPAAKTDNAKVGDYPSLVFFPLSCLLRRFWRFYSCTDVSGIGLQPWFVTTAVCISVACCTNLSFLPWWSFFWQGGSVWSVKNAGWKVCVCEDIYGMCVFRSDATSITDTILCVVLHVLLASSLSPSTP